MKWPWAAMLRIRLIQGPLDISWLLRVGALLGASIDLRLPRSLYLMGRQGIVHTMFQ